jgi:hypothetical protein
MPHPAATDAQFLNKKRNNAANYTVKRNNAANYAVLQTYNPATPRSL